ncbi:MAG: nucleotide 5'-monophosphate nucleosidase PpnN [Endozoicomonadaceae bacterium]|nr:nucleotide 5'-monophosphate nucleosidase PpnN [Endozoicomonadaceae bacterium]MCY4329080.1 nucleotide 5'-monophosphate nucleosidase PpnN [Endozoicomonadaceae bacterium]
MFPTGSMNLLSSAEVARLQDVSNTGLYHTFRKCALAVLHCNSADDEEKIMDANAAFDIYLHQEPRGLKIEIINAPDDAFVDSALIQGVRENLFSVLRDILYVNNELKQRHENMTNLIFDVLRNTNIFIPRKKPNIVVCWGGHSIKDEEYDYCKTVGYELGLRKMDICTGCGQGAMKAPMKGAYIGHAKQRLSSRLIGLSEPGIIAAETPNALVNKLIVMPDIEKRLEAFVRLGHGFVVFPGGVGTVEEILYLLGILLHSTNDDIPFPLVFTGPKSAKNYFEQIDNFIVSTMGKSAQSRYKIIIDNPKEVAKIMCNGMHVVNEYRRKKKDALYFNWSLHIDKTFQTPFQPTHENMKKLKLLSALPPAELVANLRRVMSGIVSGNIKQQGINAVKKHGPYQITGETALMKQIDELLRSFVRENRMKLSSHEKYVPCYTVLSD